MSEVIKKLDWKHAENRSKEYWAGIQGGIKESADDAGLILGTKEYNEFVQEENIRHHCDFMNYPFFSLGEVALIKSCPRHSGSAILDRFTFMSPGTIFIKKTNNFNNPLEYLKTQLDQLPLNHTNYLQINIVPEDLEPGYVLLFLASPLGSQFLRNFGDKPNMNSLRSIYIPFPTKKIQKHLISSWKRLDKIHASIKELSYIILKNPDTSKSTIDQMNKIADIFGELSDSEKLIELIKNHESSTLEFKSTLSLCLRRQEKIKDLEEEVIKTIIGFLNTNTGGTLLIGVEDNGNILGIDEEVKKFYKNNIDKYKLYLSGLIKNHISKDKLNYIETKLTNVNEKLVYQIDCRHTPTPTHNLKTGKVYIRSDPETIELKGPDLFNFMKNYK